MIIHILQMRKLKFKEIGLSKLARLSSRDDSKIQTLNSGAFNCTYSHPLYYFCDNNMNKHRFLFNVLPLQLRNYIWLLSEREKNKQTLSVSLEFRSNVWVLLSFGSKLNQLFYWVSFPDYFLPISHSSTKNWYIGSLCEIIIGSLSSEWSRVGRRRELGLRLIPTKIKGNRLVESEDTVSCLLHSLDTFPS